MEVQRVIIFEFAPTADEIWSISRDDRDGYTHYDAEKGLISILDTAHGAKQRPEIITTYAGGKATNVARVMDRLLANEVWSAVPAYPPRMRGFSEVCVELVTFLPPPEGVLRDLDIGNSRGILRASTPAGIYVQCLQMVGLCSVRPRFEVVDELRETGNMQTTRRCIEITIGDGASLNFSPRIIWSQRAAEAVLSRVPEVACGADMIVLAGAPPVCEAHPGARITSRSFYARIINSLEPACHVSIDTRGQYLHDCLTGRKKPRFAFMNTDEFSELSESWTQLSRTRFPGNLLVHDERGCWVWDGNPSDGQNFFSEAGYSPSIPVSRIYSTIGAGDAMHAGFLKEWICSGKQDVEGNEQRASSARGTPNSKPYVKYPMSLDERLHRAVVYSQVVAASSVSNDKATHGIDAREVERQFQRIWPERRAIQFFKKQ